MELADGITNLGVQTQRAAGKELDLLRVRVSDMLADDGTGSGIGKDMMRLRTTLNQIAPGDSGKGGLMRHTLGSVPS